MSQPVHLALLLFIVLFVAWGAARIWSPSNTPPNHKDHYASETQDGGYLFYSYRDGKPDIFHRTRSGQEHNLTENQEHFDILPKLHPDGSHFAFSSGPDMASLSIQTMPLEGGSSQPLIGPAEGISYVHPSWSPDGAWISYNVNDMATETGAIYVARVDGTEARNVTTDLVGSNGGSVWTPDGQWVVFSHQPGTGWETPGDLYAVHLATGKLVQLTQTATASEVPSGFTPDGKTLVITVKPEQGRHYIAHMAINVVGGELRASALHLLLQANHQDYFAGSVSRDGTSVVYSVGTWQSGFDIGSAHIE